MNGWIIFVGGLWVGGVLVIVLLMIGIWIVRVVVWRGCFMSVDIGDIYGW